LPQDRGDGCGGASDITDAVAGFFEQARQGSAFGECPKCVFGREIPLDRKAGAGTAGVPIMGKVLTEQHDLAGGEMANVVADEKHAVAGGESRRLHLDVVMPMVAFAADAFGMAGVEQGLDFAEVFGPAEDAE